MVFVAFSCVYGLLSRLKRAIDAKYEQYELWTRVIIAAAWCIPMTSKCSNLPEKIVLMKTIWALHARIVLENETFRFRRKTDAVNHVNFILILMLEIFRKTFGFRFNIYDKNCNFPLSLFFNKYIKVIIIGITVFHFSSFFRFEKRFSHFACLQFADISDRNTLFIGFCTILLLSPTHEIPLNVNQLF